MAPLLGTLMPALIRVVGVVVAVGLAGCGFPRPPDVAGDGDAIDAGGSDGPDIDAAQPSYPSCAGLALTCGANGNDSCCRSPVVPGGTYYRGRDATGDGSVLFPATVSDFRLDKYEVTVGRFRAFANADMGTQARPPLAGAGAHALIPNSGWDSTWNGSLVRNKDVLVVAVRCDSFFQTWTDEAGPNERLPMNCVTWYEAMAFCAWDDGYLPTEAEWNYAAAGGDEQRAYPWSVPPQSTMINSSHAVYDGCLSDEPGCTVSPPVLVGSKPAGDGRWGQLDLAGNVFEWVLDSDASYHNPCADCANLTAESFHVYRGGAFFATVEALRSNYRNASPPTYRHYGIGFVVRVRWNEVRVRWNETQIAEHRPAVRVQI
jgi:formylglycine-generating enzyme